MLIFEIILDLFRARPPPNPMEGFGVWKLRSSILFTWKNLMKALKAFWKLFSIMLTNDAHVGEERGELFDQDILAMEVCYQGTWNEGMLGEGGMLYRDHSIHVYNIKS